MTPDPSELGHEALSQVISGSFAMFSTHLKEAWRRRHELTQVDQEELVFLVQAHDAFVQHVASRRGVLLTPETPTMGEA